MSEKTITTVLFIGDPHFMVTNIPEVEIFIERITKLATDKKPDLIIIAGDLLHTHERLHTLPLNKAYEFVDKMRKITKTYVLVGNHDYIQNQQFLTENHWMNGMKEWSDTVIVDSVITEIINNVVFTFVPYVPPGRFQEALETISSSSWKKSDCIFAHQEFFGCKMGAIVSVEGDKWPLDYPEIISGHIHSKQKPQNNIYYSGSAMQHAFGESTKNIIAYLKFEPNQKGYKLDEIDLNLPRKKIVYMDVENIDDYELPKEEEKDKIGYIYFSDVKTFVFLLKETIDGSSCFTLLQNGSTALATDATAKSPSSVIPVNKGRTPTLSLAKYTISPSVITTAKSPSKSFIVSENPIFS